LGVVTKWLVQDHASWLRHVASVVFEDHFEAFEEDVRGGHLSVRAAGCLTGRAAGVDWVADPIDGPCFSPLLTAATVLSAAAHSSNSAFRRRSQQQQCFPPPRMQQ
jgi:hypothetical protein